LTPAFEVGLGGRDAFDWRNEAGTGTAGAFFICIGDQPELDFEEPM
jgi:hypothetical protein